MRQGLNFGRKKPLNISLVLLSLLLARIKVTNSQETIWYSSNISVTRNPLSQDYFEFWSNIGKEECSLSSPRTICEDYGGIQAVADCKESCCKRCTCRKDKPTFVAQKQHCVEDRNITGVSGANQFVLTTVAGTSCANSTRLPVLDVSRAGTQSFIICLNGVPVSLHEVKQCSLVTNHNVTVQGWIDSVAVRTSFQIVLRNVLKWSAGLTWLQGRIVSIPATCKMIKYSGRGTVEYTIQSSLYFKVPGSQTGPGPKVFYRVAPVLSTPSIVTSANVSTPVVMITPTDSTTTDHKSKLNIVHVSGKADLILVVLAAILGSILLLIIGAAVVAIVVVCRRKQKLHISGKQSTSNPTYERGPDQSLINGGPHQASLYKVSNHFYQPLVENTRMSPRNGKDPIYESLDDNLRQSKISLTENPNRCSLAFCEVTSDGYLIPTGDEHIPPEPPSRLPTIPDSNRQHSRPRLSSSYDEPEVVILDRKPKKTVQDCYSNEVKSPDDKKPTYQVLEEDSKECDGDSKECNGDSKECDADTMECVDMEHPNETVSDINKSPTENSYLELIGDEEPRRPLESEIL